MAAPSASAYAVAVVLTGEAETRLREYAQILATTGIEWGLLGPKEADRVWERHVCNSLSVAPLILQGAAVCDVGSGAGLPGIPLAIARPDLRLVLLEPLLRRTRFLEQTVAELGLAERVQVVRARAEAHKEVYDAVVARAVAPLARLVWWCAPLLGEDGQLLAFKGEGVDAEVSAAGPALTRLGLESQTLTLDVPDGGQATVVRCWRNRKVC
jgi:16S rRNA (guanine527-N7)-methyltransferase